MNILESNVYKTYLNWQNLDDKPEVAINNN